MKKTKKPAKPKIGILKRQLHDQSAGYICKAFINQNKTQETLGYGS